MDWHWLGCLEKVSGGDGGGGSQHHDGTETDRKKKRYSVTLLNRFNDLNRIFFSHSLSLFFFDSYTLIMVWISCRSFKECPHPDDKQRNQLSRELGLAPRQIKFLFQNRRTQLNVMCLNLSLLCVWNFVWIRFVDTASVGATWESR